MWRRHFIIHFKQTFLYTIPHFKKKKICKFDKRKNKDKQMYWTVPQRHDRDSPLLLTESVVRFVKKNAEIHCHSGWFGKTHLFLMRILRQNEKEQMRIYKQMIPVVVMHHRLEIMESSRIRTQYLQAFPLLFVTFILNATVALEIDLFQQSKNVYYICVLVK